MLEEQEEDPLNHPEGNINIHAFTTACVKMESSFPDLMILVLRVHGAMLYLQIDSTETHLKCKQTKKRLWKFNFRQIT